MNFNKTEEINEKKNRETLRGCTSKIQLKNAL